MTSEPITRSAARTRRVVMPLAGNRLVIAGVILYFLEWVAIVGAGGIDVLFSPGTNPAKVLHAYIGHSTAFGWAAGWFSVVLLGRSLFAVALRHALVRSGHQDPRADFGVLAVTAGVVFEVGTYALVMAAAIMADQGRSADVVTAFDTSAFSLETMLWGTTGMGTLALSWAMLRSGLFSRVLTGIGLIGGALLVVDGLGFNAPRFSTIQGALQVGVAAMWTWMIWTGIVTWRASRSLA